MPSVNPAAPARRQPRRAAARWPQGTITGRNRACRCRHHAVPPIGGAAPAGRYHAARRRHHSARRSDARPPAGGLAQPPLPVDGGHIDAGNCWRPRPGAPACLPLQARCSAGGCRRDARPKPRSHCSGTSPYLPPAHTLPMKPLTYSDLLPHGLAHSVHYWWGGGEGNGHLGRQPAPAPQDHRRRPSRKALEYKKRSRYAR